MILATKFKPDEDAPFRTALDAGMRAAEIWTGPDVLDDWRAVATRAQRFDLRYRLHFPTKRTLTDAHLRNFVELSRALDVRVAVIHRLEMERYGEAVQALDPDLQLAVENGHLSPEEFARWQTTNRYLTLDAEHVWLFTHQGVTRDAALVEVAKVLQNIGPKLRHVHLPGYYGTEDEHRPMYCSPEYVTAVASLLDDVGYDGFVVSEVDVPYQNVDDLRRDVELFENWRRERNASRIERK